MQEIIKKWHEDFNIRDFYDKNNINSKKESFSAYALLTEEQYINFLCEGDGSGNHINANHEVASALMGINIPKNGGLTPLLDDNIIDDDTWQHFNIIKNKFIEFRMINEQDMYDCDIFFPDKITINQYYVLESYLKKISKDLSDILEKENLFYYSDDYPSTNDYKKVLEYALIKVDNNLVYPKDLFVIGTSLNSQISR